MTKTQSYQQEWQGWLDNNLERQCDPVELYNILRENGFNTTVIQRMMGEAFPSHLGMDQKISLDHQALYDTPLGKNDASLSVTRFDTDLFQLYIIENFMSAADCEHLIELSASRLRPSEVTHSNGDDRFRTSSTGYFTDAPNPFVNGIEERIARTLGIRLPYSEPLQIQSYDVGQEFKAHHDYFAPDTDIYQTFAGKMGQRTWTFMVYLNSTPKGGGTFFTEIGHTFYPKQGMAVIWNNLNADGSTNPFTMHHGMPVEEGKKVIITKWFREKGHGPMFYG